MVTFPLPRDRITVIDDFKRYNQSQQLQRKRVSRLIIFQVFAKNNAELFDGSHRAVSHDVSAPNPNGNFQDVTQQRGGQLKILATSPKLIRSTQWQWIRQSNMTQSGYLTWIFLLLWGMSVFLPLYSLIMAWFFFVLIKYSDTFRNNCGQWKDSTSCDEVRHSDTSETEGCVSP